MRYEIRDRIQQIIEGDSTLRTGELPIFKVYKDLPAFLTDVDLPCVIPLARQDTGYQYGGGNRFDVGVEWDIRVYLGFIGTKLHTIRDIEVLTFPDLFATAFLSRGQLQFNDNGLSGVAGNLTFRIASDLAVPLQWPPAVPDGAQFWGFIARISVPFKQVIQSKIDGL